MYDKGRKLGFVVCSSFCFSVVSRYFNNIVTFISNVILTKNKVKAEIEYK